jgi:hypothetical protein
MYECKGGIYVNGQVIVTYTKGKGEL